MPYCSVLSCRHQSKFNNLSNGGISYHRFPHDPHLKEKWVDATGRQNWVPTKLSTICSHHFDPKCFIVKQSGYRYLSDKAEPTLNIVKFYVENHVNVKEEPSSDSESNEDSTPQIPELTVKVKIEPHTDTDFTDTQSNTTTSIDKFASSQIDTPEEQRLKKMLRGRNELVKRQKLKIKQLQSKLRRLSKKYARVEAELEQRKIEDDQRELKKKKCVLKKPESATKPKTSEVIEFVKV